MTFSSCSTLELPTCDPLTDVKFESKSWLMAALGTLLTEFIVKLRE